jgi:hypothetical protein
MYHKILQTKYGSWLTIYISWNLSDIILKRGDGPMLTRFLPSNSGSLSNKKQASREDNNTMYGYFFSYIMYYK